MWQNQIWLVLPHPVERKELGDALLEIYTYNLDLSLFNDSRLH